MAESAKRKASTSVPNEPKSKQQKSSPTKASRSVEADEPVEGSSIPEVSQETIVAKAPPSKPRKKVQPRQPIKTLFTPWKDDEINIELPEVHDSWGRIPMPDGEPQARPDLPSARASNAQTIPPLWEDRKYRFKPGRYHKSFGPLDEVTDENAPDLDQEDNLIIKLMDMRPVSKKNPAPKRNATFYVYENGKPKDWENAQALKALNDRRREAIWRITQDAPWTDLEREYLARLCSDYPDASILEYAERFNYRFKGDFKEATAFRFHHVHEGRTLESIRHEYLTWKPLYDAGKVPDPKRLEGDKTDMVKKDNKRQLTEGDLIMAKFDKLRDPKEPKKGKVKKSEDTIVDSSDVEDEPEDSPPAHDPIKNAEPKLSELDEELAELAGYYNKDGGRSSPAPDSRSASPQPTSPARRSPRLSPVAEESESSKKSASEQSAKAGSVTPVASPKASSPQRRKSSTAAKKDVSASPTKSRHGSISPVRSGRISKSRSPSPRRSSTRASIQRLSQEIERSSQSIVSKHSPSKSSTIEDGQDETGLTTFVDDKENITPTPDGEEGFTFCGPGG
jgi:hypothetical protein